MLLLDTCAVLWVLEDAWLKPEAVAAIDNAHDLNQKVHVSPITAWEIGILARKGRFRSSYSPRRWLEVLAGRPEIAFAGMPPHVLMDSSFLPGGLNNDPADRIIVATAREYGYTLVTRDADLLRYASAGHLSALEC
jgi:PIN domain nuclease of toxin-antitoxin system